MSRGELLGRAAHLAGLWGLAVVLPLFDLLGDRPEFFTARGATGREIVAFAIGAALVPPLLMLALELLAGIASASLAWALQLAYVVALVAAIVLQLLPFEAWLPALGAALALGAASAVVYARSSGARSALMFLAPAPLVLLAVFVLLSDVSPLVTGAEAEAAGVTTTRSSWSSSTSSRCSR